MDSMRGGDEREDHGERIVFHSHLTANSLLLTCHLKVSVAFAEPRRLPFGEPVVYQPMKR